MDKPIGDKPFSFADYPHIKKRMDQLFDQFKSQTSTAIRNSLEREDALSADKAADLAAYYGQVLNAQRSAAVQQIANRIVGGMNLSERIWHISDSFYKEIETALDIALRDGTPADRLATELKQYLRHPDKLFRRVRDEHGQLRLSKAAQAYHPGQGIYRSSFRNARRLAVTETNMAYHAADHERWQALDFVLGYEVQVSGTNPNVCPLCMELAGKYPKEFKFVGWHPHCRCHALPILEKPQAFKALQQALLRGERIPPIGAVKAPPDNFTAHLANNTDRIASAQRNGTLPYYLRDNYKVAKDGTLTPTFASNPQDQYIRRDKKREQEVFQYRKKEAKQKQQSKAKELALVASSGAKIGAKANIFNSPMNSLKGFQDYDTGKFEQTYNNPNSKGYVVRDKGRIAHGSINKQERHKLDKETRMAKVFADGGYKIEMLYEAPGVSTCDALINGSKADFKSVTSYKQILKRAKEAVNKQEAEKVLLELDMPPSEDVEKELDKVRKAGIKGLYYYKGVGKIHKL